MRVAKLYRYTLPVETGIILRQRRLKQREGFIVHLNENGRSGWGEIAPLPEFSKETLAECFIQLQEWLNAWQEGKNPDYENYYPSVAFGLSFAVAELNNELALEGNYQSCPLCYGDPDELYQKLNEMKGEKIAKMKVGLYEANRDGLIADMFLQAIPELKLRLDANRAWSLEKAMLFADKISPERKSRIQFIEEPCQTPELSRQFSEQTGIAIAWDESTREADFWVKKEPNLTAIIIKPTLIGSFQKCKQLVEQAHTLGVIAVISSSIESSLALTQLARFANQFTPQTLPGLDTLNLMQAQLLRQWTGSALPLWDIHHSAFQAVDF